MNNTISYWSHRADGGLLVSQLLLVSRHHVFDLQLLHDLLLLQVRVLLLSDGASQLLGVGLGQTGFQLGGQRVPLEGGGRGGTVFNVSLHCWKKVNLLQSTFSQILIYLFINFSVAEMSLQRANDRGGLVDTLK